MSTFVSTATIFIERTRRHAAISALLVLQRRIAADPERAGKLRAMPGADFERIFLDPQSRLRVADVLISGSDEPHEDFFLSLGSALPASAPGQRTFLPASPLLERLVDPHRYFVEPDPDVVRERWELGLDLIDRLCPGRLGEMARGADLICGLRYEWSAIRAFSNSRIPGFIAFNVCAPPVILAEQIVHEAAHVAVAACLDLESRYRRLAAQNVAAFSPFTDSVRTVDRVVHGIISYHAVRRLWRGIAGRPETDIPPEAFGDCADRGAVVARRLDVLDRRLRVALLFLSDALDPSAFEDFLALFSEFFPEDDALLLPEGTRESTILDAGYGASAMLPPIARAEIALARTGAKVSRVTVPVRSVAVLGFALAADGPVVPASWAVSPIRDDRLDGFSNVTGAERPVMEAQGDDEVHLYVSRDATLAREAAALDGAGQAGALLGIPECCRRWFGARWDDCRRRGGDLFADMIREHQVSGRLTVAPECDASAMFRGGGLCWHFPCSPKCAATIELIRARRVALDAISSGLLADLGSAGVDRLWLDSGGRYHVRACPDDAPDPVLVEFGCV